MTNPFEDVDLPSQRRDARERTVSLLYEAEMKSTTVAEVIESLPLGVEELVMTLAIGVADHQAQINDHVAGALDPSWTMGRLAVLDRIIMGLGAFELEHRPDVPTGAIINEAVELAKHFSGPEAGRFVNGVLANLATKLR